MSRERVRAWRPAVPGVAEVLHADFVEHAYPPHVHDTWTLFVVDDGEIRYDLDRHRNGADRTTVGLLPPHVVHDGRPASARGYRKRVVYVRAGALGEELIGPAVDRPALHDRPLRRAVDALHRRLADPADALEAETLLALVVERLRAHLGRRDGDAAAGGGAAARGTADLAERLRALLDAGGAERVTLASAAARLGASPAHLVRAFGATFGIAPHAYLVARRVEAARALLLEGEPPARVAASVGFYDQAHLTRHFRRHVGTTPGRFASGPRSSRD